MVWLRITFQFPIGQLFLPILFHWQGETGTMHRSHLRFRRQAGQLKDILWGVNRVGIRIASSFFTTLTDCHPGTQHRKPGARYKGFRGNHVHEVGGLACFYEWMDGVSDYTCLDRFCHFQKIVHQKDRSLPGYSFLFRNVRKRGWNTICFFETTHAIVLDLSIRWFFYGFYHWIHHHD